MIKEQLETNKIGMLFEISVQDRKCKNHTFIFRDYESQQIALKVLKECKDFVVTGYTLKG